MATATPETLARFSSAFIPVMHFFHNLAAEVSRTSDFTLAQYRVLMLVHTQGPIPISLIKQRLNTAQSTASELVERLTKQDLLTRENEPRDRRIHLFQTTDKANRLIQTNQKAIANCFGDVFQPLSEDEQYEFVDAFETISRAIRKITTAGN